MEVGDDPARQVNSLQLHIMMTAMAAFAQVVAICHVPYSNQAAMPSSLKERSLLTLTNQHAKS